MSNPYLGEVVRFVDADRSHPLFGLVYGRRRIGKSTLLAGLARERGGFYFEAIRGSSAVQLARLGTALGEHLGVGRLAFTDWSDAFGALLGIGGGQPTIAVIDEFGYLLEAEPTIGSVLANALGPGARASAKGAVRLICCGSAISVMRSLTAGQAPLRGRAGLELVMHPDDFRTAAQRLPTDAGWDLATRVYATIGGVVGYATDMVNFDLPAALDDFERWVEQRVLSPGATLLREGTTLLAEDPSMAGSGALLHHSILAAVANGALTAGAIAKRLGKQVSNLAAALNRLVDAGFISRHDDPLRDHRPTYELDDPFLRFHFAVIEPHGALLRDRGPAEAWRSRLGVVFDSRVRGPVFEIQARRWVRQFASAETIEPGMIIGLTAVTVDGVEHQVNIAAADPAGVDADGSTSVRPADRRVVALGEAKAGETLTTDHLQRLERIRSALGSRARDAKLFLVGAVVDPTLTRLARRRPDIELVDLDRLYTGS